VNVVALFDDFAARWARGEHPDVRDYLERAGAGRDELASLLDGFLAAAPVQQPSEETITTFAALLDEEPSAPPLLAERVRRGWRREEIVEWIRDRFGIAADKRERLATRWHELETGLIPMSRVSESLREALVERFGEVVQAAVDWTPPASERPAQRAFAREADTTWLASLSATHDMEAVPTTPEPDDVDRLFGVSPLR
jgi:hypothetical protein